ncbi:protein NO VEIN domain-containing protein [Anaeromyxobacter dehalogenans]|nr:DUF3883 domain-containing protein [Anaeromyxobacter dehalogenans]
MDKNADIAARFLDDAEFRAVLTDYLVKKVHRAHRALAHERIRHACGIGAGIVNLGERMNYWVYKCNTKGEAVGNSQWGDWEDEYAFGGDLGVFDWGNVTDIPDLARPKKGDIVIAHQSDRHKLVGIAKVLGLRRDGQFLLKAMERIGADMSTLKQQYAKIAKIPAYQGGWPRTIYDIGKKDAELLLRLARASVASIANGGAKNRQRLAGALDPIAALEDDGAAAGKGGKATKGVGQGFGLSSKEQRAVERRAVELAKRHFESGGWVVEDVGDSKTSLDLVCRRKGIDLHVEVKGTTGLGQKIILTKNEVQHAKSYKRVALVVVHGMKLKKGTVPKVSGGKVLVRHPWKIADKHLEPLAYYYKVA